MRAFAGRVAGHRNGGVLRMRAAGGTRRPGGSVFRADERLGVADEDDDPPGRRWLDLALVLALISAGEGRGGRSTESPGYEKS